MKRFAPFASFVIAGLVLGGCPETARCPEGQLRVNRQCVVRDGVDGGPRDAGPVDAGPCGVCPNATPFCVVDRDGGPACRECDPNMGNDTCEAFADRPYCDPDTERCVECTANEQCMNPAASRCSTGNECMPCAGPEDCALIVVEGVSLPYCLPLGGSMQCVECTPANEIADCEGFVCDPVTLRCTTRPRGVKTACEACVSDSECVADHYCVPLDHAGAAAGYFCLRDFSTSCVRPSGAELVGRTTRSGATGLRFCGVNEELTTCEAVLALVAAERCTNPADCAARGARCESVLGMPGTCTYSCASAFECPSALSCPTFSGYCGGPTM